MKKKLQGKWKERMKSKGYIYFVKFGDIYKIGNTTNLDKRMSGLLVSNPFVQLYMTIELFGFELAERVLHRMFLSKKVSGEWFNLTKNDFKQGLKIIKERGFKIIKIRKYPVGNRKYSIEERNTILEGKLSSLQEENNLLKEMIKEYDKLFKREFYEQH